MLSGVMRKLDKLATLKSMKTKLHPIVCEFYLLESKRLKSILFVKGDTHQDDVNSFEVLS